MMTWSLEDANDAQWYDSLQLWYLFRRTLWQQDVSLSKALAQPIPSLQDPDLLASEVPSRASKPVSWQLALCHTFFFFFFTVLRGYFTFQHQNSSHLPNLLPWRESLIDEDKKRKGQDKLEGLVASNSSTSTPHRLVSRLDKWGLVFEEVRRGHGALLHGIRRRVAPFAFNQTLPIRSDYNGISSFSTLCG